MRWLASWRWAWPSLLLQQRVDLSGLELRLAAPVFTRPEFSLNAMLSVALPLFLITLTGQYMPGMLVLRNDGFKTSANPIVTITGLGSLLMAPFGSHAFNIAAITAAICTGRESHEDPSKRWIAGIAAGVFYILVGVFGVTLAAVFMAFPRPSSPRWRAWRCWAPSAAAWPARWPIRRRARLR